MDSLFENRLDHWKMNKMEEDLKDSLHSFVKDYRPPELPSDGFFFQMLIDLEEINFKRQDGITFVAY